MNPSQNYGARSNPGRPNLDFEAGAKGDRVRYLRLLWSQRRFLLRTGLTGAILSLVVSLLIPVSYESRIRLLPPAPGSSALLALASRAIGRGDAGSDQASSDSRSSAEGENDADSDESSSKGEASPEDSSKENSSLPGSDIRSRALAPAPALPPALLGVETTSALILDALGGPTVEDQLIQKFDLRHRYHVRYFEDARKLLAARTEVKVDRKSGVISITVSDQDPYRAQQMAAAYPEALNALLGRASSSSARRERIFLEQRLKEIKTNLDSTARELARFAGQSGAMDVPFETKAMVAGEARLESQLAAAESELERMEQTYTDRNIRVRRLRASVGSLRDQVESIAGNQAGSSSPHAESAGGFPSLRQLSAAGLGWGKLYRTLRIQESIYRTFTQEYELAKLQEARETPTINVLDAAVLPETKSFPPRSIMVLLGAVLSFFFAGIFVISASVWKRRESPGKRLAAEIWRYLGSEVARSRARLRRVSGIFGGGVGADGG